MIAITLHFKNIKAARQALLDIPETLLAEVVEESKTEPTPKKAVEKPAPAAAPAVAEPTPPKAAAPQDPKPSAAVDYPTLQKAVFALAGKSREAAAAVAAGFGVKTFKELGEDKWGKALGAVQKKLTELESA